MIIQKLIRANLVGLLFVIIIFIPVISFGQNVIPDGTSGETFKQVDSTKLSKNKYAYWNEFDGPLTSLKLGMGWMYEYANYIQDETSKEQVGHLQPDYMTRDFRFVLSGKFKVLEKRNLTWKVGIMYDGAMNAW